MKDLVKKVGLGNQFRFEPTAASTEKIKTPAYFLPHRKLAGHVIDRATAHQLRNSAYDDKMHLLVEFAGQPDAEVADP